MNDITILWYDDWCVLYVNGEDKKQNHNIDIDDIIQYCPISKIDTKWISGNLAEYVMENGNFPSTLKESQDIGYE